MTTGQLLSTQHLKFLETCDTATAVKFASEFVANRAFWSAACCYAVTNPNVGVFLALLNGGVGPVYTGDLLRKAAEQYLIDDRWFAHCFLLTSLTNHEQKTKVLSDLVGSYYSEPVDRLRNMLDVILARTLNSDFHIFGSPILFYLHRFPALFVGFNGDFNTTNDNNENICHNLIAFQRQPELLLIALERGADPNQRSDVGIRPWNLVHAARAPVLYLFLLYLAGGRVGIGQTDGLANATSTLRILEVEAGRQWEKEYHQALSSSQLSALTHKVLCSFARMIIKRAGVGICIGLQSLDLPALIVCEILQAYHHAWPLVPFHCYWQLATTVKHFSATQGE